MTITSAMTLTYSMLAPKADDAVDEPDEVILCCNRSHCKMCHVTPYLLIQKLR